MSPLFKYTMVIVCTVASGFWLAVGWYLNDAVAAGIGTAFGLFAFGNLNLGDK